MSINRMGMPVRAVSRLTTLRNTAAAAKNKQRMPMGERNDGRPGKVRNRPEMTSGALSPKAIHTLADLSKRGAREASRRAIIQNRAASANSSSAPL